MLKTEHWWWNAARVEIDQRARDARLQLEHLERLFKVRLLPTQRFFRGGCVQSRATKVAPPGPLRRHTRHFPTEACIAASGMPWR